MHENTLRLLRLIKDCKQEEIAELLNISPNTYSRLERNPNNLTIDLARKLSKFYGIHVEDILSDKIPVIIFSNDEEKNQFYLNELIHSLKDEIDFLKKLNKELIKIVEVKDIK